MRELLKKPLRLRTGLVTNILPDHQAYALATNISIAFDAVKYAAEQFPSRELSLVITKLEEAELWLSHVTTVDNYSY